ncbi:unnamed protein product [Linum tenue]|uniref:Uncharacterized protein n=1 Tax=Linum tenue TaxID=586396 RepID=A0AAV0KQR1_9ROSI|nr:unnamed protein product [Linum tenue]CAI0424749.1 unnamed protein product [Linum tenue]
MQPTCLSLLHLCSLLLLVFTFHATSVPITDDYSTYIVHLDPSSRPKHFTTHQQWHSSIVSDVKSSTSTTHHHFSSLYQNALHGFSAVLSQQELQTLQNLPGSFVLASWIPNDYTATVGTNMLLSSQGFNLISGTSMACPHASGVAALLKGTHPEWSHAAIRSAMMTTANELDSSMMPIKDVGRNFTAASPLAMGAGHMVPNKAMDPGLVYDAAPQDYVSLLCSMNFTRNQIMTITRSNDYNCANSSLDLNYPSFVAFYDKNVTTGAMLKHRFRRVVTNVGGGAATYKVKVAPPEGVKVAVWPQSLVFGKKYEQRDYYVEIVYPSDGNGLVSYGSIVWIEESGKHIVRSPIVVSPTSAGK